MMNVMFAGINHCVLISSNSLSVASTILSNNLIKRKFSKMSIQVANVLLLDNVDPMAKDILEKNGIKANLCKEKYSAAELTKQLQSYDGVVVRSATKLTSEIISSCPNLKIIGRAGTGVDNIDVGAATENGVIVMNTPGGNTLSAAEHTCTLICCMARNVPGADASMKAGRWDRKLFMGHELMGKTLAIVGLGRIGREVAARMQSFGMTTIGFDPLVSVEEAATCDIQWLSLDEIWPRADYITVHTPLIPQTKGLLGATSFPKCKRGVRIVNCARGGIVDEDELLKALQSGVCGGAALDVFVEEPATNQNLVNHPRVIACPHLGASTAEAQARCGREIAQQIADVAQAKSYFGVLNAPALQGAKDPDVSRWCDVIKSLSRLARGFPLTQPTFNVKYSGKVLARASHSMKAAACRGLLCDVTSDVNLVNSMALAKRRGIEVESCYEDSGESPASCQLICKSENHVISLSGDVVSGIPSLTSIDGRALSLPVPLQDRNLVFMLTDDVTSCLASLCAESNVNVTSLATTCDDSASKWVVVGTSGNVNGVNKFASVQL